MDVHPPQHGAIGYATHGQINPPRGSAPVHVAMEPVPLKGTSSSRDLWLYLSGQGIRDGDPGSPLVPLGQAKHPLPHGEPPPFGRQKNPVFQPHETKDGSES